MLLLFKLTLGIILFTRTHLELGNCYRSISQGILPALTYLSGVVLRVETDEYFFAINRFMRMRTFGISIYNHRYYNHRYYNLRTRDPGLETGSRAPMTTIELLACTPRCNFC